MESIFTWNDLFKLTVTLILLYVLLKLVVNIFVKLSKKTLTKRNVRNVSEKIFVFYMPIGISMLLIVYVGINLFAHGILILIFGLITFRHIRAYLNGVLFRSNPLVEKGRHLVFENYQGLIERLLPFGVIVSSTRGKRFINYTEIERLGFSIEKMEDEVHQKVLYLTMEETKIKLLDLLFENPLVNLHHSPILKKIPGDNQYKLQFTLEKGATAEEIIAFLNQYQIKATPHKPKN